jgi:protoporphyrinogen oxidase
MTDQKVIIVGGGISGLTAAVYLRRNNVPFELFEATDRVGGKLKTDIDDGYLLDRGFHLFFTAYPEAKLLLDYKSLGFRKIEKGVIILHDGKETIVQDQLRGFLNMVNVFSFPFGTFWDKVKLLRFRWKIWGLSYNDIFRKFEIKTSLSLRKLGFSKVLTEKFFKPVLNTIYLENELKTSRRLFEFICKMIASGDVVLPESGIEAIPKQLAAMAGMENIRTNCRVVDIEGSRVILESGEVIVAGKVLLATELSGLAGKFFDEDQSTPRSVTCLQYEAKTSPFSKPYIAVNAGDNSLISSIVVISDLVPSYSSSGKKLIYVSVNGKMVEGDEKVEAAIRKELTDLIGNKADNWKLLKVHRIENAVSGQVSVLGKRSTKTLKINDKLFICGDHLLYSNVNGAMLSGRLVAEVLIKEFQSHIRYERKLNRHHKKKELFEKE